ncbi:MAG: polyprenol monophosphomannose synthase [Chloroflexota bacterium]|jgi:dolichol-phosphate mannosyltransferase|nr:polyprenol monophosphomannose synthase [Chloroflexota bacterium]
MMMKIIQLIPTYNEAENLPVLVKAIFSQGIPNFNILVLDDNSPDGTGEVAERLSTKYQGRISVLHRQNKEGLGKAYIQGLRYALDHGADVIGMMDADLSHPPECLPAMFEALQDADLVIGSRYVPGGGLDKEWPFWRKALSAFGNFYARTILSLPVKDATGGFRLWRRSALEAIPFEESRSNGYIFQVEMAYLAKLAGLTFAEVPIYFAERTYGESKMSLRIQIEAALRVWQLRRIYRKRNWD